MMLKLFPISWSTKTAKQFDRNIGTVLLRLKERHFHELPPSMIHLFRILQNPTEYSSSHHKLSWILMLMKEYNMREPLFNSPLTYNDQIIHPSSPSIQQDDAYFIGIHSTVLNLLNEEEFVKVVLFSPLLMQFENMQVMRSKISNISCSYICNEDELILFSFDLQTQFNI